MTRLTRRAETALRTTALVLALATEAIAAGDPLVALVDDFSDGKNNALQIERQYLSDAMVGGNTTITPSINGGVLSLDGEIVPPRGQPGWASTVLLLDAQGKARDASKFSGIRLRIRVDAGMISVSANSTEVANFDYHAAQVSVRRDGQFHEVRLPFQSMKRAWSPQTTLNPATIASLSIVAFDVKRGAFEFEIDEIGFY